MPSNGRERHERVRDRACVEVGRLLREKGVLNRQEGGVDWSAQSHDQTRVNDGQQLGREGRVGRSNGSIARWQEGLFFKSIQQTVSLLSTRPSNQKRRRKHFGRNRSSLARMTASADTLRSP